MQTPLEKQSVAQRGSAWVKRNAPQVFVTWLAGFWLSFGTMRYWADSVAPWTTIPIVLGIATVVGFPFGLSAGSEVWRRFDNRLDITNRVVRVSAPFDRHAPAIVWFGGGCLSFLTAASMMAFNWPRFSRGEVLPGLLLFGCVSVASLLGKAIEAVSYSCAGRSPRDSLHPGQFALAFVGLVVLGLLSVGLLIAGFGAVLVLSDVIKGQHATAAAITPWAAGVFLGLYALWLLSIPLLAAWRWFGARRDLERMRDDALLGRAGHDRAGW